jgi:hypothetical protein
LIISLLEILCIISKLLTCLPGTQSLLMSEHSAKVLSDELQ